MRIDSKMTLSKAHDPNNLKTLTDAKVDIEWSLTWWQRVAAVHHPPLNTATTIAVDIDSVLQQTFWITERNSNFWERAILLSYFFTVLFRVIQNQKIWSCKPSSTIKEKQDTRQLERLLPNNERISTQTLYLNARV